jgi:OMF family outer membrane factor
MIQSDTINIGGKVTKLTFPGIILILIITIISLVQSAFCANEVHFNSLDEVFSYSDKNSSVIKTGEKQSELARLAKMSAIANIINFKNPVVFTMTDNTLLPLNFIPAEFLGGQPGTYREITFGQKYVSNFNFTPQIDLINPGGWAKVNYAGINQDMTDANNLLDKKNLYQSLAACFYNITSMKDQINIVNDNLSIADSLFNIVSNKYQQGIARQQDVNDAQVNKLNVTDKLYQLKASLEQQYNSLKILCDIPQDTKLTIAENLAYEQTYDKEYLATATLEYNYSKLRADLNKSDLTFNWMSQLPIISVIYSNSYYQNSNNKFFDNGGTSSWLNSVYIGLKLSVPVPDVNSIFNTMNAEANYKITLINSEHDRLQNDIQNNQLKIDYDKAYSQVQTTNQVYKLKSENYRMAMNQYNESILGFDKVLDAFTDMLTSKLNNSTAVANFLNAKSKIEINNRIK